MRGYKLRGYTVRITHVLRPTGAGFLAAIPVHWLSWFSNGSLSLSGTDPSRLGSRGVGAWELARSGKVRFGVLSYRIMEPICMIEPLWRAARNTRLLLRTLGGNPSLAVNQELHFCPNSTAYTISRGGDERVSRIV